MLSRGLHAGATRTKLPAPESGPPPAGDRRKRVANARGFFAELKRRNVPRAAVLYAGGVWALAQGIAQLGPTFGMPDWGTRWFVIACVIGFPFWIAVAWFYEFTSHGLKRDSSVPEDAPSRHSAKRKLDFAIIGVLVVAVVLLASGYFIRRPAGTTGPFNPPRDSLVVLPFKNLSGDSKQQYFSDGITEELTGALGQNPGLRVIAWDTASTFRGSKQTATEIGRRLNVANLLHGSILRAGDEVRITAELVNTATGYQLWSAHYDGSFKDIFKVQDEVSEAISGALKIKFAQSDLPSAGTVDPRAHELVLKGRELSKSQNATSLASARKYFEQAIAIDPGYAEAHALLSLTLLRLTEFSSLPLKTTLPKARAEAQKALALDPRDADGWVALGFAEGNSPQGTDKARSAYRKALALDPSNAAAHIGYGNLLPLKPGMEEYRAAAQLDPQDQTAWNNLAAQAQDLGKWQQQIEAANALLKLDPKDVDGASLLAFAYQQLHQYDRMVAAFERVTPITSVQKQQVAAGKLTYQAVRDPKLKPQALAALEMLASLQSNQSVAGNLLQFYLALGETRPALQLLDTLCPANPIGCSDLGVNPQYHALHGNPGFEALVKTYNTVTVE